MRRIDRGVYVYTALLSRPAMPCLVAADTRRDPGGIETASNALETTS